MRIRLIPNYFVHVFSKDGCPLRPTCSEWKLYKKDEVETRDHQYLFEELLKIEKGDRLSKVTNEDNPILMDSDDEVI